MISRWKSELGEVWLLKNIQDVDLWLNVKYYGSPIGDLEKSLEKSVNHGLGTLKQMSPQEKPLKGLVVWMAGFGWYLDLPFVCKKWCQNSLKKPTKRQTCYISGKSRMIPSLKLTASLHLNMDGWNTIVSFWGPAYFQVRTVSFRGGIFMSKAKKGCLQFCTPYIYELR